MPISFLPKVITKTVTDIRPDWLKSRNIRLLMLDFDNTIVPYTTSVPAPEMENWLRAMAQGSVQLCVVSNSKRDRVKTFCEKYGLPCITHSKKPFPKGIRRCLAQFGKQPGECAIVGDQIFTDTLGGNCAGLTTILVRPIDNHNFWLKARHVLEQPFIILAKNRRISHEKS